MAERRPCGGNACWFPRSIFRKGQKAQGYVSTPGKDREKTSREKTRSLRLRGRKVDGGNDAEASSHSGGGGRKGAVKKPKKEESPKLPLQGGSIAPHSREGGKSKARGGVEKENYYKKSP